MFSFWFRGWLNRQFSTHGRRPARIPGARRSRVSLEVLEERVTPTSYTVNSGNDSGTGTLRQAILDSNGNSGPNEIDFIVKGRSLTITLTSKLPDITTPVFINGAPLPDDLSVVLMGASNGQAPYDGLDIKAPNCTVEGLVINHCDFGIALLGSGTTGCLIAGNYLGTDINGTKSVPNSESGVLIDQGASKNTVGGKALITLNVLSGNLGSGITIRGGSAGNLVENNLIGVNSNRTTALGNLDYGVEIYSGAANNFIGATGVGNVISGNGLGGVVISDSDTSGNVVQGNTIGVAIDSTTGNTKVVTNGGDGIDIVAGARSNTVGGHAPNSGNIISGNTANGVWIDGGGTNGNVLIGNLIGTDSTGLLAIANKSVGVLIQGGADDNTIGGKGGLDYNVISGNAKDGVLISDPGTISNVLIANLIGLTQGGTGTLPNGQNGVEIGNGAQGNTIGDGGIVSDGNSIAGNTLSGVYISGSSTSGNVISGSLIGTTAADLSGVGNKKNGIFIDGATNNTIGGTQSSDPNVIAGNSAAAGILIANGATGNVVEGNDIGFTADGTELPNAGSGITVGNAANDNTIAGNTINENSLNGVVINDFNGNGGFTGAAGVGNTISENSIFGTTGSNLSIDLANGGNDMLAAPVLTFAGNVGGAATITGTLTAGAAKTYIVEFFASTVGNPSQGQTYLGNVTVSTSVLGTGSFTAHLKTTVATDQYVTATATGVLSGDTSEISSSITVADHLAFVVEPSSTLAGSTISPAVTVEALDPSGTLMANDNLDQVTVSLASGLGTFAAGSTVTVPVIGGIATFNNLILDTAGTDTLAATASGLAGDTSSSFTVSALTPDHLAFKVQPGPSVAGQAISPAVQVQVLDTFNNLVTADNTDQVTLSTASGPATFDPLSTTTAKVSGGIATFSNLALDTAGVYTLGESATGGLNGPGSSSFTVSPAAANLVTFTVQPTNSTAGVALSPVVQVKVFDKFGNFLSGDNSDQVSLYFASGAGTFDPSGKATATVSGGIATFSNLIVDSAGTFTLGASVPGGGTGPVSSSFTIIPTVADHLNFSVLPSNSVAGTPVGPAVQVEVVDRFGNLRTNDSLGQVSLTIASGPGTFAPGSTTTATLNSGVASFSNLVFNTAGTYTLGSSISGGLIGPSSSGFTVSPAAANHLAFSVAPSNSVAGTAINPAVQVQVFDRFGNFLSHDNSDQVSLYLASGKGGFDPASTTTVSVSGGYATFNNLVLDTAGNYTLGETATGGLSGPVSNNITVSPAAADHLSFSVVPSDSVAGVAIGPAVQVKVFDRFGNLRTNDNTSQVTVTVASGRGPFTPGSTVTATVFGGIATFSNLVLDTAGSYTLAASATGGAISPSSNGFTISPAAADHLGFTVQPSAGVAGAPIGPAVRVQVLDRFGNYLSTDNTDQVTLSVATGPGTFDAASTIKATVSSGVATFSNLAFDKAGIYTLGESATGGLSGPSSNSFAIVPAAANHLTFAVGPSNSAAGTPIGPSVQVQEFDHFGNLLINDNTGQVTVAVARGPGNFTSFSTTTVTVNGGAATFSNLVLDTSGSYTLAASVPGGASSPSSGSFTISPAAANQLTFAVQPGSSVTGSAINPAVQVQVLDRFGNLMTNDNSDQVSLYVASGPGTLALSSSTTVTVSGGVATFSNLMLNTAGSYTLGERTTGGLRGPSSSSFTVSLAPPVPDHLGFSVQPIDSVAGTPVTSVVQVLDRFGNLLTNDNSDQVTLAVVSGPGTFDPVSTFTATVSGGIATFTNLVFDTAGSYVLGATVANLPSGILSNGFSVSPAAADHLSFTSQPGTSVTGFAISPAVQVQLFDRFGNLLTNDNSDPVTMTVASGPGSLSSSGTTTVTATGGIATFSDLILTLPATNYTLQASSGSLTPGVSNPFTVISGTAGSATHLVISAQPKATIQAGTAFTVTIRALDAFGNLSNNFHGVVGLSLLSNPGGAVLHGTTSRVASGGMVTFSGLTINQAAAGYTLQIASGSLIGATSNKFTIQAGAATHLVFMQEPPVGVSVNTGFGVIVEALDAYGNLDTTYNGSISLAVPANPSHGAVVGQTAVKAVNGVAVFTNVMVNRTGLAYTLRASSGKLKAGTSTTFDVTS